MPILAPDTKPDKIPSRAVIAQDAHGNNGVVLWYSGDEITCEINEMCSTKTEDLGLDDAPPGISVWEGYVHYFQCGHPLDPPDWDCDARGEFRRPTPQEWEAIRENCNPWKINKSIYGSWINTQGLTFNEWKAAAHAQNDAEAHSAWEDGEDPTEYAKYNEVFE